MEKSLQSPVIELTLRAVGSVRVAAPDGAVPAALVWQFRRWAQINYRAFADEAIGLYTHPTLSSPQLARLSPSARRRLLVAVVRAQDGAPLWRALHGSHLTLDERFLAVTLWTWRRERERWLTQRLRAAAQSHDLRLSAPRADARTLRVATDMVRAATPMVRAMSSMTSAGAAMRAAATRRPSDLNFLASLTRPPAWVEPLTKRPWLLEVTDTSRFGLVGASRNLALVDSVVDGRKAVGAALPQVRCSLSAKPREATIRSLGQGGLGAANQIRAMSKLAGTVEGHRLLHGLDGMLRPGALTERMLQAATLGGVDALTTPGLRWALDPSSLHPGLGLSLPEKFRDAQELWADMAAFAAAWEEHPLWFLLALLNVGQARRLAGLTPGEVHAIVLAALEFVVRDGRFVAALRETVRRAPHLHRDQRAWLDHALDHAQRGDWVCAIPLMLVGLEGAVRSERRPEDLTGRRRHGRYEAAETLIKEMAVEQNYKEFAVRLVFGGTGNAFRHGAPSGDARQVVLFAVVALAGWVDAVLDLGAMRALAGQLGAPLLSAAERQRQLPR